MSTLSFTINNIDDLSNVAAAIVSLAKTHKVFTFNGEMGAGKTTLISLICEQIGITDIPSSPTYAIVNTYMNNQNDEMYHFDFYRIADEMEAVQSGLDEMIDSGKICFIEWPERILKLLPESFVEVKISILGETSRKIDIQLI